MSSQQYQQPPPPLQGDHITARIIRNDIWRPAVVENDWSPFVVVGPEGSGKSLTCASILKAADPSFTVENAHFNPVDFLQDIADEDEPPGAAVQGDEAGVSFGKRTWHDREQIEANQALQTARDGNKIIGLTIPRLEDLDSQLVGRVRILVEMVGMAADGDHAIVKWKRINPSRDGRNETRTKFPRTKLNGVPRRVTRLRIGPPPESLAEPYQRKKQAWKDGLYDRVIDNYEDKDSESGLDSPKEIVGDIRDRDAVEDYIDSNGDQEYVNTSRIAYDYEVGDGTAKKVKQGLKEAEGLDDVL